MGIWNIFRRKKKKERKSEEEEKIVSDLEKVCTDDKEADEALVRTMLLNPQLTKESIEEAAKKAEDFEKSGDVKQAKIWYGTAGGLAIFQGRVEKVKQFFGKCKELSPNENYKILEIPERAVQKAQEYYQKYLKPEEKKKK